VVVVGVELIGPVFEAEDNVTNDGEDGESNAGGDDSDRGDDFGGVKGIVLEPTIRLVFESNKTGIPAIVVGDPFTLSIEPSISTCPEESEDIIWLPTVARGAAVC
jgi:hypothetical protein